ncbi:MAG: hypothetical protein K2P68_08855 [Sphingomonas sp.]|nr:hypothetical protein [Sphingomonas sp.]
MTSVAVWVEAAGWVGSALCLCAYLATSLGIMSGASRRYQWMNFLGGAALTINVLWHRAYPAAVLEICWTLIGLAALIRIATRHASERALPKVK